MYIWINSLPLLFIHITNQHKLHEINKYKVEGMFICEGKQLSFHRQRRHGRNQNKQHIRIYIFMYCVNRWEQHELWWQISVKWHLKETKNQRPNLRSTLDSPFFHQGTYINKFFILSPIQMSFHICQSAVITNHFHYLIHCI